MDDLVKRLRRQESGGKPLHVSKADRLAAADRIEADAKRMREAVKMLDDKDREYNRLTNDMIERHAAQIADLEGRLFTCSTDLDIYLKAHASAEARVRVLEDALREIEADCEAEYPPSHGAIKYRARAALEGEK